MNKNIQQKTDQYRKTAKSEGSNTAVAHSASNHADGLAQVIRSKKDADDFMAELKSIVNRVK